MAKSKVSSDRHDSYIIGIAINAPSLGTVLNHILGSLTTSGT